MMAPDMFMNVGTDRRGNGEFGGVASKRRNKFVVKYMRLPPGKNPGDRASRPQAW